jgi:HSP20 family protein
VEVRNGDLVLQGGRNLERHETDGRFHTMERGSGYFVRQMKLPRPVNKEAIKAEFKDGVLRIVLPKIAHEDEY